MSFFRKSSRGKYDDTEAVLRRVDGKMLRYVAKKDENGVEEIVGKGGRIVVTDTEVAVICGAKDVFRCDRRQAVVSELLSLDGVRLSGPSGAVTAYYTYYRK